MLHEDGIRAVLKPDGVINGGNMLREMVSSTINRSHLKCSVAREPEALTPGLLIDVSLYDNFELQGASALRVVVDLQGDADAPRVANSYLCTTSATMHRLINRPFASTSVASSGLLSVPRNGSFSNNIHTIRISIARGRLAPSLQSNRPLHVLTSPNPPASSSHHANVFVPLDGQSGLPYSFEWSTEKLEKLCRIPQKERDRVLRLQQLEYTHYYGELVSRTSRTAVNQRVAAERAEWEKVRAGTAADNGRVFNEADRSKTTTDIVIIDSGEGRVLSKPRTINAPPEICSCPKDHTKATPARAPRSGGTGGRSSSTKKPAKAPTPQKAKDSEPAADTKELASSTCNDCKKVNPPPRGKKLGRRKVGNREVIKYVPLSADAGFDTAESEGYWPTPAARTKQVRATPTLTVVLPTSPKDQGETSATVQAVSTSTQKDVLSTPSDGQGETSVTEQEQPAAVQDTVLPAPFDEQGETSITAQEQSAATQGIVELTPNDAQNASPETPDAPVPRAVSSPPDLRKRTGDSSLEEPPAKRLSLASGSTVRDEDDEEVDPPKPVIKFEESEIITIEDDGDDAAPTFKHRTSLRNKSAEEAQLQHQLQLVEMDERDAEVEKRQLQLARKKLELKHKLETLRRPGGFEKERPIKIED